MLTWKRATKERRAANRERVPEEVLARLGVDLTSEEPRL